MRYIPNFILYLLGLPLVGGWGVGVHKPRPPKINVNIEYCYVQVTNQNHPSKNFSCIPLLPPSFSPSISFSSYNPSAFACVRSPPPLPLHTALDFVELVDRHATVARNRLEVRIGNHVGNRIGKSFRGIVSEIVSKNRFGESYRDTFLTIRIAIRFVFLVGVRQVIGSDTF